MLLFTSARVSQEHTWPAMVEVWLVQSTSYVPFEAIDSRAKDYFLFLLIHLASSTSFFFLQQQASKQLFYQ